MSDVIKSWIRLISHKFPSVFLKYLRNQLKPSELTKDSLYKITKAAHTATNLSELYKSIHFIVKKLMYAENFYIAIYDEKNNIINFPYHVDEFDDHEGLEIELDD